MSEGGGLVVCATPIGNLGDVSERLRITLSEADVIYAEDTRRTAVLLNHLGISSSVRSLFVGNEEARTEELVRSIAGGRKVALVTDAGMPGISDPGAAAVRRVREAGHPITVIPGPSAVTTAIALAGFDGERFVFEGFLPKKGGARTERLRRIAGEDRAVVLFVSPHRLQADLADLASTSGVERQVVVTRELTKLHEEVWSGAIGDAIEEWSERAPKGEFTIVLAPADPVAVSIDDAATRARELVTGGASPSNAAREIAAETGLPRREIYEALLGSQERS
ncbi:MAG TPA: 16S rRNA (cytidine(1402)-2'-O)-methyltransferase [Acidimicrobiia bacterium]|nr:16S rRNA (cytidine(1402)-2'-O)-methyltransferase [Acidimicrobiia bacterium]